MKRTFLFFILSYASSYSQTFDGNLGTKSLNWTQNQKDFTSPPRVGIDPMSIKLWDNYNSANSPSQYGSLLEINGRVNHLVSQLYFVGSGADNDKIKYRTAFYGQNDWTEWRNILDSKNDVESTCNLKIEGDGYIAGNFSVGNNHGVKLSVGNSLWISTSIIETGYTDAIGDFTDLKVASYRDSYGFIRILKNGNVGIGATNPDSKLTVAGKIHAQEVKVTLSAGTAVPDYVFAKDYKLKSLNEVEEYIKQNSHLPEIPSAQEIEKNGLMLADMNMSLLKKIEEMTLYMIEQGKEIKNLKKENEALRTFSDRLSKIENQLEKK
ncbi:tail fiber protein [[Flexibacter] sp. ATCC 35103]|uniref:tail fiber protein n=1 Tax=[Flexibacter] sp. ATCC 35103 TaxID=1937528 RepID=UPI0009D0BC83|nr:tail fiber protein [[Flexibacter] sp. ATCC 35103]OMQ12526.1 hypothetical protein BXU01_06520 [[Flexibacter] sp. ATCC 35103]